MTKTVPFQHQIEDTAKLVKEPSFALFSEMGTGKSKIVIDAACHLAEQRQIDTVIIVCPASVRSVWLDAEMGEIRKHSWLANWVAEFHSKCPIVWRDSGTAWDGIEYKLQWIVTNYEFLRAEKHLKELLATIKGYNVLLVCDESSYIKSRTAEQTKAIFKLREKCSRVVLLNGTPLTHSPLDLFSQMAVLDRRILGDNYYLFRAHYCEMVAQRFGNGPTFQKIVGYRRLDELQNKIAPYCLRRLKKDCLDLPEKLYTVREVALMPESWKRYQTLKKEAVIALEGTDALCLEPNAAVRIMRLSQMTSGHIGSGTIGSGLPEVEGETQVQQDLSSEKLNWIVRYLTEECASRYVIVWCRWRRERERLAHELRESKHWDGAVQELYGGQGAESRKLAIETFSTDNRLCKRAVLIAQPHAGGVGLNLVAATEAIYLSNDWSLGVRLQSEDRCHRPGQKHNVLYTDVLAAGPEGQTTIDHIIMKALRDKQNLAEMTTAGWRKALNDDGGAK